MLRKIDLQSTIFHEKNRKGEITTAQIVTIIVLIVSFIVILYFFFRLNLGVTTNSEICHNSVVLQAKSAKLISGLQCKTDFVCISGGGTCENLNPTITLKVDSTKKNETMKALADQMANCWWMFGEGQMDYLGLKLSEKVTGGSGCAVCSIVGIDNKISAISYKDFIDYLAITSKDSSQTYLQYLYGVSDVQGLLDEPGVTDFYNSETISSMDQFSVITGESKGAFSFFSKGDFLHPVLLKTTDISKYLSSQCGGNFFTQT